MAKDIDLVAEFREDSGKGASRRLRRQGKVPAIIYGGGRDPRSLTFQHDELIHSMEKEAFFSSVLSVKVGKNVRRAIIKDVQTHPARRQILHLDLQRVMEDQEIRMTVPIHYLNEESAVGVKQGGGTVSKLMTEVEITCLPKDLPEYLELDIADLELDALKYLGEIELPEGVSVPALTDDNNPPVVNIHIIKEEVEPEEEELEGLEGEEGEEGAAPEEGEAPAGEGEEKAGSDDES